MGKACCFEEVEFQMVHRQCLDVARPRRSQAASRSTKSKHCGALPLFFYSVAVTGGVVGFGCSSRPVATAHDSESPDQMLVHDLDEFRHQLCDALRRAGDACNNEMRNFRGSHIGVGACVARPRQDEGIPFSIFTDTTLVGPAQECLRMRLSSELGVRGANKCVSVLADPRYVFVPYLVELDNAAPGDCGWE